MTARPVLRDERTELTENASYRWAYLVLSFGLLLSTAYRGFVRDEQAWDLLALVVIGGAVASLYQARHRVLSRGWALATAAAVAIALLLGVALAVAAR